MIFKRCRISWPNALTLFLAIVLGVNYLGVFTDLDWSWHVRLGEQILQTGSLRTTESFSFTINGTVLPDFEWLYEVALWEVWNWFGVGGLKLARLLLCVAPLCLVAWRLHRDGIRWHGIALAMFLALYVLAPVWNLRPLFFTTLGLLLVSGWLRDHCAGKRMLGWGLPVVMLLWANLHPGVITGQGLLAGAIGWEWLNQRLRWNPPLEKRALWRLTWVGGLGFIATFLCPDPLVRLRYTFNPDLAHPVFQAFTELRPMAAFWSTSPFVIWPVFALGLITLVLVVKRFRHFRMWELALLAGLTLLANVAIRSMMDWFLVMLTITLPQLKDAWLETVRSRRRHEGTRALIQLDNLLKRAFGGAWLRWQPGWFVATLSGFTLVSVVPALSNALPNRQPEVWPIAALDFIERSELQGNFFAPSDFGAYIGWRLKDRGKIYTDTRGFFFPPELVEDCHFVPQLGPRWRERLDRVLESFPTDYFLLETEGPRGALWRLMDGNVATIYRDGQTVLLTAAEVKRAVRDWELRAAK